MRFEVRRTLYRTCYVVNVILDDEPEAVGLILVLLHLSGSICLGHGIICVGIRMRRGESVNKKNQS